MHVFTQNDPLPNFQNRKMYPTFEREGWGIPRRTCTAKIPNWDLSTVELNRRKLLRVHMKFHTEYLSFNTKQHREYVHITPQVEKIVRDSGVHNGMALVSAMHITAGVYVNDNEEGLIQDIDKWLENLAPFNQGYLHHQTGEDNGESHLK